MEIEEEVKEFEEEEVSCLMRLSEQVERTNPIVVKVVEIMRPRLDDSDLENPQGSSVTFGLRASRTVRILNQFL